MRDRRKAPRRPLIETGVVITTSMSVRCVIEDISDTGARLTFAYALVLPSRFRLLFEKDGREEHAQMIWRNGAIVGVSFSRAIEMAAPRASEGACPC
jgi:hypothetical protein